MRKINKNFDLVPQNLQDCFKNKESDLLEKKEEHKFDGKCYNAAIFKDLNELYHEKCAFCETRPEKRYGKTITIEHYRPKSDYYWLGYEWTNLFFACAECNGNKDNNFGLQKKTSKVLKPQIIDNQLDINWCKINQAHFLAEEPFFLHPEIDEPNEHFTLDLAGNLNGKTTRGIYTCDTLKLNRPNLTVNQGGRKYIIDQFVTRLRKAIQRLLDETNNNPDDTHIRIAFFDIFNYVTSTDEKREFTFLLQELSERFDEFFIQKYRNDGLQNVAELLYYGYYDLYKKEK